jgi:hypothetical protein
MQKRTLWFVFEPGGGFEPVPLDQVFARLQSVYDAAKSKQDVARFDEINRASLQTLWEWSPSDALALKQISEARRLMLPTQARSTHAGCGEGTPAPSGSAGIERSGPL